MKRIAKIAFISTFILASCQTTNETDKAQLSSGQKCVPVYEQVYQPPLKIGGTGRVINVKTGENCLNDNYLAIEKTKVEIYLDSLRAPLQLLGLFEYSETLRRDEDINFFVDFFIPEYNNFEDFKKENLDLVLKHSCGVQLQSSVQDYMECSPDYGSDDQINFLQYVLLKHLVLSCQKISCNQDTKIKLSSRWDLSRFSDFKNKEAALLNFLNNGTESDEACFSLKDPFVQKLLDQNYPHSDILFLQSAYYYAAASTLDDASLMDLNANDRHWCDDWYAYTNRYRSNTQSDRWFAFSEQVKLAMECK